MENIRNTSVIAMKGQPLTRKTEFAKLIASSLKCPVLSLDGILDSLNPDHWRPPPITRLEDVAFGIIIKIAETNLSSGILRQVVIDSPLSSRSHLDRLIQLAAKSLDRARLVIVECKPGNIYAWKMKFEEDLNPNGAMDKWYKPKSWEDVEKATSYDETSDGYKVSKLVLDPISDYLQFEQTYLKTPPFIAAVRYMLTRSEDEGPDLVVYHQWRQGKYSALSHNEEVKDNESDEVISAFGFRFVRARTDTESCIGGSGHYITNYEDQTETETECVACENRVTRGAAAYSCKYCSFTLHKECAELVGDVDTNKAERLAPYHGFGTLLKDCFIINLKNRLMPTIIRHECEPHFLTMVLSHLNPNEEYSQCRACGESVISLWYACKICSVAYHYGCLVDVPRLVKHEHGGHHHHMALQYSCQEEEDYICLVCVENEAPEKRDPTRWFYSCQECEFVAHQFCVYKHCNLYRRRVQDEDTSREEQIAWELKLFWEEKIKNLNHI